MLFVHGGIKFKKNEKTNSMPIHDVDPDYIFLNVPNDFFINVSEGDLVDIGYAVASSKNDTSSPIYSGVSGHVERIENNVITIKNDFKKRIHPGISPVELPLKELSDKDLESLINLMGIYDGAVPLSDKIKTSMGKIENIIINCTDSQPPAGISHPIAKQYPKELLGGIKILIHATKARRGIITLSESNEKTADSLKQLISDPKLITVRILENKYPTDNEKYLIYTLTKKEYRTENLVEESRILVLKPESVISLYRCFTSGIPVVNKAFSLSGKGIENKNISAPIGTKISFLLNLSENPENNFKIIKGGIMNGTAVEDDAVIYHDFDSITLVEETFQKEYPCIRCGRCIETCPMLLKPLYLYSNIVMDKNKDNTSLGITNCIECGCCSYVCPSKIPLTQTIKTGKSNF